MTIRFRSVSPMLQSSDLQRTIDWYESVLGSATDSLLSSPAQAGDPVQVIVE